MSIGNQLKFWRESEGLNQSELARATGINQQTINLWEANKRKPNIEFCIILADFYGISLDELIGREVTDKK